MLLANDFHFYYLKKMLFNSFNLVHKNNFNFILEDIFSVTFLKNKKNDLKYYKLIFLVDGIDKGLHQSQGSTLM